MISPWLATMQQITGTDAAIDNATIVGWARKIGEIFPDMAAYAANYTTDTIAWCGLTAAYCMAINGIRPPFGATDTDRFLWALAWQQFGVPADTPQPGDVIVFAWADGGHHVTFLESVKGSSYVCRGGNQSHKVGLSTFPASAAIAVRRAPGASMTIGLPSISMPASYSGITATVFGGAADHNTSAYDGHVITDTELGVALPYHFPSPRPQVKVSRNGQSVVCTPVDVGSWNTDDEYWKTGSRPLAEICYQNHTPLPSGPNKGKVPSNPSGIDLTPAVAKILGIDGKGIVDWQFVSQEQPSMTIAAPIDINALAAQIAAMLRSSTPPPPVAAQQIDVAALAAQVAALLNLAPQSAVAPPAVIVAAPPQITLASTLTHLSAFAPIIGIGLQFLPPPWNAVAGLVQKGISAAIDVTAAVQTDPASVGTVVNSHMDVISDLLTEIENIPRSQTIW